MLKPIVKESRKLTNIEVLELYDNLKNLKGIKGVKLNYAISRTINNLKPLAEAFTADKLIPISDGYNEFKTKLNEAYKNLSCGSDGKPRTRYDKLPNGAEQEVFDMDINSKEAQDIRAELQAEYATAIDERTAQVNEYNEWLNEECAENYAFHGIMLSDIPEDITKEQWDAITLLVNDKV